MKGLTIKAILKANGKKMTQIAELLGESQQNFSYLLSNDDVKTSLVERISEATGIPIATFYGDSYAGNTIATDNGLAISGDGNHLNTLSDKYIALLEKKDEQIDRLISIIEKR